METRFTRIIDELAQLGKNYTQNENRVLKSLPPSWKVKVTTIKEMHNINDYHIDNLFGNLRAYEEDNILDLVIPKVEDKKKNMALKSILIDEDENDEDLNEEIALLTRQLRRVLQSKAQRYGKGFLKSNNQQRGKINQNPNGYNNANNNNTYTPPKPKEQNSEETQDVCFECKQPGHFKRECPKLSKGRTLVAENGWDLSEDEESSEANEEVVNLCLNALEDEASSTDVSTSNQEVRISSMSLHNQQLLNLSDLNLLDICKNDLIDLLMEMSRQNNQRFLTLWSEKEKIDDLYKTQTEELSRIKESNLIYEEENSSLCEQNDLLKNEINENKDVVIKLKIENTSLVLQNEELKNKKLQINENSQKLHVDLLNLKIQNESLTHEESTLFFQQNLENVQALKEKDEKFEFETQRLKDEHSKILDQVLNQEKILNEKIKVLSKEKEDLEITIQKFTKGNEMLDRMVHSKISYNHEGLGYDKNAQPKEFVQNKQTTFVPATPIHKCSYCNKNGHTIQYCKFKNGEIKGKHIWVRKGTKPYVKVEHVPNKNVSSTQRQPRFSYVQKPIAYQNRNTRYNASSNGESSRSHYIPSQHFYHQNAMYYRNDRNNMYRGGNSQRYNYSKNTRYVDNNVYARNYASRNSYMQNYAYTMPSFYHANSNAFYNTLTQGPSRQKGTNKFN
ncbi:uncharacterized protein LOC135150437 [Daucus carota subsp. sativus]|uniref:uncharacterized protein LOC135150437 n=1 Tax=Daucus carota subsp. sativus TaxID=79200 RepID=UPI00308382D3